MELSNRNFLIEPFLIELSIKKFHRECEIESAIGSSKNYGIGT